MAPNSRNYATSSRHGSHWDQLMAFVPAPPFRTGRLSPWGKLDEFRKAFDRIVFTLIDRAEADPGLGERADVLALLLRNRDDDGTRMPRQDICDELLTILGAGFEGTASALGWVFERLRRHPGVLAELVREVDEGGSDFRRATILESLRTAHDSRCDWPTGQGAALRPRRVADSA